MKLIKPIKVIREKCDGSEPEDMDIYSAMYYANQEIEHSKVGQFEKLEEKLGMLSDILSFIIESIDDKQTIENILSTISTRSDYYSYNLKEEED